MGFAVFESWWRGVEADQLVDEMGDADIISALRTAGIEVKGGAAFADPDTMKAALKAHYTAKTWTARQVRSHSPLLCHHTTHHTMLRQRKVMRQRRHTATSRRGRRVSLDVGACHY